MILLTFVSSILTDLIYRRKTEDVSLEKAQAACPEDISYVSSVHHSTEGQYCSS
jgi:hypothetical protein